MDRNTYKRFRDHEIRDLLRRARAGDHVYDDEIAVLNLPPRVKAATKEALDRATDLSPLESDRLAAELFQALPDHHETERERQQRRADHGDPDAIAAVKAQREATSMMADRILGDLGAQV